MKKITLGVFICPYSASVSYENPYSIKVESELDLTNI